MKHIFFINQQAGQGNNIESIIFKIHEIGMRDKLDYQVIQTKGEGSAEILARKYAKELGGEDGRFYAIGGDGTINDVVNGIIGYDNLSLGIIPVGTGNDTVRSLVSMNNQDVLGYDKDFIENKYADKYSECVEDIKENFIKETNVEAETVNDENNENEDDNEVSKLELNDFLNIENVIYGETTEIDLIRYWGIINDKMLVRYCINMINLGLDCDVVDYARTMKKKPLIKGHGAYLLSAFAMIIKKKGISLRIVADGKEVLNGPILLTYIANGNYYGGGMCSSPQSSLLDNKMDLNIVKNITRTDFLQIFPYFKKGEHYYHKKKDKVMETYYCDKIEIYPYEEKDLTYCVDGEIFNIEQLSMESVPMAVKVILPKNI